MVIVKRSLDAAKAISAGKRSNLIASAAIVCIPARGRVIAKVMAPSLRFGYCQSPENRGIALLGPGGDKVKFAVQFASKSGHNDDDGDGNSRGGGVTGLVNEPLARTAPAVTNVQARIPLFALHSPICSQLDSSTPAVITPILS
jgi:hypothetical protein